MASVLVQTGVETVVVLMSMVVVLLPTRSSMVAAEEGGSGIYSSGVSSVLVYSRTEKHHLVLVCDRVQCWCR